MSTHELEPIVCENCGHDEFVETTTTRQSVVGKFSIDDKNHKKPWITLLEPLDAKPQHESSVIILTCERCGVAAYEKLAEDVVRTVRCT
jgi:hypothetical protein